MLGEYYPITSTPFFSHRLLSGTIYILGRRGTYIDCLKSTCRSAVFVLAYAVVSI